MFHRSMLCFTICRRSLRCIMFVIFFSRFDARTCHFRTKNSKNSHQKLSQIGSSWLLHSRCHGNSLCGWKYTGDCISFSVSCKRCFHSGDIGKFSNPLCRSWNNGVTFLYLVVFLLGFDVFLRRHRWKYTRWFGHSSCIQGLRWHRRCAACTLTYIKNWNDVSMNILKRRNESGVKLCVRMQAQVLCHKMKK